MFPACSQHVPQAERKYGPIADFDVSGITDMKGLFQGLGNINEDISSWDTSSVTTMKYMFYVRALALDLQPSPSLHVANTAAAHRPAASARTSPRFV